MKIITLLGSPRIKGNTAKILGKFEELAIAKGHKIDRINIVKYKLNGCLGCDKCKPVIDEPGCIQKDDMMLLFDRMIAADVIIYATPLYAWDFTAQMKTLIDRQYCLVKNYDTPAYKSFLKDKPVALLVTCGAAIENNADLIPVIFKRECNYTGSRVIGPYIAPCCTTPAAPGRWADETARKMADEILADI